MWDQRRGGKGEPQEDENWMTKKQRNKLAKDQGMEECSGTRSVEKDSSEVCNGKQSAAKGKGAQTSVAS